MSIVPRSIKSILTIDVLLYICGILGIYLTTLKGDLPFDTQYQNSIIKIREPLRESTLSLVGQNILNVDGLVLSSPEETETYLDSFRKGDKVLLALSDQSKIEVELTEYYSIPYNILAFIIGTSFFFISIVVLIKAQLQKPARLFHWVCVFTALIIMATWGNYSFEPKVIPIITRTVLHFAVCIVPALFLHFTLVFPEEKKINTKYLFHMLYSVSGVILLFLTYRFLSLISDVTIDNIKLYVLSYNVSRIYLITCVIFAVGIFIHSYKTSAGQSDKKKLKWILYGLSVGPLSFILLWTLPIMLTDRSLVPEEIVIILISVIPITFGISIVKYHVMDIDYLINRSVVYSLVIAALLVSYLFIIGLLTNFAVQIDIKISSIISAIAIALLFQPIKARVQKFVDRKFFRVQYNFREAIGKLFSEINESNSIQSLAERIIKRIDELIPVEKIGFFLLNASNNMLKMISHKNFNLLVDHSVKFEPDNLKTNLLLPVALADSVESGVNIENADVNVFRRWGMNLVFPIKSSNGDIRGFLVLGSKKSGTRYTIEDVDLLNTVTSRIASSVDRIKLQEELILERVESERLDELNRLKSFFISSVSHDMKTPLTSIKMFSELLQSSSEIKSEKSKEYLDIIEGESSRLSRLIDNVLDFSKIERGIKQYRFENIKLNEIVVHTFKLMHYQFMLNKFVIESNLSNDEKFIYADKDAIEEALINLLSNSLKYSKENKIIRVITNIKNEFMALTVEDKGIGIDKNNLQNIFNPFFRIGSKEVQRTGGTGLGLSIIKHIMNAHKGKIDVQSEPGKGSRFTLLFPVVRE